MTENSHFLDCKQMSSEYEGSCYDPDEIMYEGDIEELLELIKNIEAILNQYCDGAER